MEQVQSRITEASTAEIDLSTKRGSHPEVILRSGSGEQHPYEQRSQKHTHAATLCRVRRGSAQNPPTTRTEETRYTKNVCLANPKLKKISKQNVQIGSERDSLRSSSELFTKRSARLVPLLPQKHKIEVAITRNSAATA